MEEKEKSFLEEKNLTLSVHFFLHRHGSLSKAVTEKTTWKVREGEKQESVGKIHPYIRNQRKRVVGSQVSR